jgi:hypothetical protein
MEIKLVWNLSTNERFKIYDANSDYSFDAGLYEPDAHAMAKGLDDNYEFIIL